MGKASEALNGTCHGRHGFEAACVSCFERNLSQRLLHIDTWRDAGLVNEHLANVFVRLILWFNNLRKEILLT